MALNLALGVHFGAGVPLQKRCQVQRNLVTRKAKTLVVVAANPAVKYEAGDLVSITIQSPACHRNLVTKRDKRIMVVPKEAAIEVQSGDPKSTHCRLENETSLNLSRDDYRPWNGSGEPPKRIAANKEQQFDHIADATGSIAGASYVLGDSKKIKWVIAWSNSEERRNKVYTRILDGTAAVNWDEIKDKLESSNNKSEDIYKSYSAEIVITAVSDAPTMRATLNENPDAI